MAEQKNSEEHVRVLHTDTESKQWDEIQKIIAVHEAGSRLTERCADTIFSATVRGARLTHALLEEQRVTNLLLMAIASKMLKPDDVVKSYCVTSQKQVTQEEAEEMEKKGEI